MAEFDRGINVKIFYSLGDMVESTSNLAAKSTCRVTEKRSDEETRCTGDLNIPKRLLAAARMLSNAVRKLSKDGVDDEKRNLIFS